ncbi:divalent-cation tolerance protein CutA [Acrocarpospora catenulata]|uniref:divalent-cation tolerance protein CutA n=1 Tax=Acrocarpospora catenulata TaxID=2836182 RepID=UPI001BD98B8E|nr:divalent-cation tolerance protein CutA [Acrocarpospora catenulata]
MIWRKVSGHLLFSEKSEGAYLLMVEYIQVYTRVESSEEGTALAQAIVEARLAAAVSVIGPVHTFSRYDIGVEVSEEWQLVIKTARNLYPELERHIRSSHSYENPEIIVTPVLGGSHDYLDWVGSQLNSDSQVLEDER